MNRSSPLLTTQDAQYLASVLSFHDGRLDRTCLQLLQDKLARAEVVDAAKIPPDVVTTQSRVHLQDLNAGETIVRKLVFPGEAAAGPGTLSVLAPVGLAVLGRRVGEQVHWPVPGGEARFLIRRLTYQPEAGLRRSTFGRVGRRYQRSMAAPARAGASE